ncbi:MAG: S8 family peptidase [Candidatus Bathyarchaeota archaeon]|nr:S8 family peptidase [Candidatus Bathyarchaeota archaeon]
MRNEVLVFIVLMDVLMALSFKPIVVQAQEVMEEKLPYFAGFRTMPGPEHIELVESIGGEINFVYHIIPVIAVNLTSVAVDILLNHALVEYIEQDCTAYAHVDEYPWGVNRIDADEVHPYEKGFGVKVAVLDTGIDYNHVELEPNYKGGRDVIKGNDDPVDDIGHGTEMAGVIMAAINNEALVGVAPECTLYAVKSLKSNEQGEYRYAVAGIQWAMDNGMQIISMSWGGDHQESLERACKEAYDSGILLVASTGNDASSVEYPAAYDSVIAVSATDQSNALYTSSNRGPEVELAAPGVYLRTTTRGGGIGYRTGTSLAAAHVAGVAALIWGSNPSLTNEQVRQRLQDTAEDLPNLGPNEEGYGLVDAEAAVTQDRAVLSVTPSTNTVTCGCLTINVQLKNEADFTDRFTVTTYYDTKTISTQWVTVASGATKTLTFGWCPTKIGTFKIKAKATIGNCEHDTSDNTREDGYVAVIGTGPCVVGVVGGYSIPVDKLALLAPYIGLASTIVVATVATVIYVKRVKHRKEK